MPCSRAHSAAADDIWMSSKVTRNELIAASARVGSVDAATNSGTSPSVVCRIGQGEVGEGRADHEVGTPVDELLGGQGGVVADLGDTHLDRATVDAAVAVGQLGDERHQVRAGDVDEADDVAEVHGHADPDRIAGRGLGAVLEIGAEDAVDVDRAAGRGFARLVTAASGRRLVVVAAGRGQQSERCNQCDRVLEPHRSPSSPRELEAQTVGRASVLGKQVVRDRTKGRAGGG